jgi:holo-[acyl-carrier protein] synthase
VKIDYNSGNEGVYIERLEKAMHHIGVDIIEIARIEKTIARWGEKFLHRIYSEPELRLYRKKPSSLAARFACKEAVMKLLEKGRKGINWREVETLSHPSGKPLVNLYGRAQSVANKLGVKEIAVSLSHSREYAIALVTS